jgi:hypothetical protein
MTEPEIPFISELRGEVRRAAIAQPAGPVRQPQHVRGVLGSLRLRRRISVLSAGGVTVVAAAIAAVIIVLGAGGTDPAPAYAVTLNNNNSVTIHWNEWKAIGELNARLTRLDMRIRVVPIVHGCVAPVHVVVYAHSGVPTHIAPGPAKTLEVDPVSQPSEAPADPADGGGGVLTTWNNTLPGRTRIFTATRSDGWGGGVFTVVGPAPPCVGDGG